eukprot:g3522.t1
MRGLIAAVGVFSVAASLFCCCILVLIIRKQHEHILELEEMGSLQPRQNFHLEEWELLGQTFFGPKVSEIVMDSSTAGIFGLDRAALDTRRVVSSLAVDMLSVSVMQTGYAGKLARESIDAATERMERWGIAVLQGALDRHSCSEMAAIIKKWLSHPTYKFGDISERALRHDYPLEITAETSQFLEKAVELLQPILSAQLGDDAELVELSSLTSWPGAGEQPLHPDAMMEKLEDVHSMSKIYSIFIYLDDVEADMAPLDVQPGTHTHFHFLENEEKNMLFSSPMVRLKVPAGTIAIMDCRTHHRGSNNTSDRPRPVFYFSLRSKKGYPPSGPTYSLRKEYEDKFTLSSIAARRTAEIAAKVHASWKGRPRPTGYNHEELGATLQRLIALSENSDMEVTKMKALEDEIGYVQLQLENHAELLKNARLGKGGEGAPAEGAKNGEMVAAKPYIKHGQDNPASHTLSEHVIVATALNFAQVVQWREYMLFCFFDPRSAAFENLRGVLDDVAHELHDNAGKWGNLALAAVNSWRDSYLTEKLAWEMRLTDQSPHKESAFLFGRPNYSPFVIHLFRGGLKWTEYTGVVESSALLAWLKEVTANPDAAGDQAALKLRNGTEPFVVGCFEGNNGTAQLHTDGHGGDGESTSNNESGSDENAKAQKIFMAKRVAFQRAAEELRGDVVMVEVVKQEICSALLGHDEVAPGSVHFFHRKYSVQHEWQHLPHMDVLDADELAMIYSHRLHIFSSFHARGSIVQKLTPDNSHVFLGGIQPLLIALLHPSVAEAQQNDRAKLLLRKVAHKLGRSSVQLTWADGSEFAPQFGVETDTASLPAIVLVGMLETNGDDFRYNVYNGVRLTARNIIKWIQKLHTMDYYHDEVQRRMSLEIELIESKIARTLQSAKDGKDHAHEEGSERRKEDKDVGEIGEAVNPENRSSSVAVESDSTQHQDDMNRVLNIESKNEDGASEDSGTTNLKATYFSYIQMLHEVGLMESYVDRHRTLEGTSGVALTSLNASLRRARSHLRKVYPDMRPIVANEDELIRIFSAGQAEIQELRRRVENVSRLMFELENPQHPLAGRLQSAESWLKGSIESIVREQERLHLKAHGLWDASQDSTVKDDDTINTVLGSSQQVQAIERRHWRTLSMSEFFHEYAVPKRPVIITGLQMTKVPWTLEHVREVCGHYRAEMKRRAKNTTNWGGLVEAETIELADFIDTFATNATRQSYYLHDWSLPSSCPEIMGSPPYDEFIMPKYFAGDYFQRVFPNNFQHSWPSLFIGADGTQSDMHIDSGATNFWLFLLSGEKKWRFFDYDEILNLYPIRQTQKFKVDVFDPNYAEFPLYSRAKLYEGIQRPGDLMFIPGGCPHAVKNMDHIHALSMNYVDHSNYYLHLLNQLFEQHWRSFEIFTNGDFPQGLFSKQDHITYGEFKSTAWYEVPFDLF